MGMVLKLSINPGDVAGFRRHALLIKHALSKPQTRQITTIYFDTPDFQLKRHNVELWIRRKGRNWMQTLTVGGGAVVEPHRQREWESRLAGPYVDRATLTALLEAEPELISLLLDVSVIACLEPVFTTDCRRTVWRLCPGAGQQIELALEQGEVRAGNTSASISELEFALCSGVPSALFDFALSLQRDVPLSLGSVDKVQRGYALRGTSQARPVVAERFALPPDASVLQGLQIIVGNCASHIQGNVPGVLSGDSIECIHQMRVGLRRLRCALEMFDELWTCPPDVQSELAWLTGRLGQARDWDVLSTSTLPALADGGFALSELAQLQQCALRVARRERQRAAAAVDSVRNARLWLLMGCWLTDVGTDHSGPASSADRFSVPLIQFMARMLRRYQRKLRKRCVGVETGGENGRHRLRIAAKKLRYATEFFLSYCPTKSAQRFVTRLADLQDAFGAANDAAVASRLLIDLAQKYPGLLESSAYLRGYLAASAASRLGQLAKRARRFAALKRPLWRVDGEPPH